MKYQHQIILFVILLLTSIISLFIPSFETYMNIPLATRDRCPTRNMSYDIRGDIPITRKEMIFNNSAWGPLDPQQCQNKVLM
jgi:hypothetical protein